MTTTIELTNEEIHVLLQALSLFGIQCNQSLHDMFDFGDSFFEKDTRKALTVSTELYNRLKPHSKPLYS